MFNLYRYPMYPVPFHRVFIKSYTNYTDLIKEYNLTDDEFIQLLEGKIIREEFEIELSESFVRRLKIDEIARAFPDGLLESEIAAIENCSENAVRLVLHKFYNRLKKRNRYVEFLINVREYRKMRDYSCSFECSISEE